jgi:hypothetical protein
LRESDAATVMGAWLRRASTGGGDHEVKALGRGVVSARAARGGGEEGKRRMVVHHDRPRKKKGEGNGGADSVTTGGKERGVRFEGVHAEGGGGRA